MKKARLFLLLALAALLYTPHAVESRDNPVRPCLDTFEGEVERLWESIRARFGQEAKISSLPKEIVPELEWLEGEKTYLSKTAEDIGSRASSLESEEFFLHSDEDSLQSNIIALQRDFAEFNKDSELFGDDASTLAAEIHRHNTAQSTFQIPDEQTAADQYAREKADLDARRTRLITRQNELRSRAEQLDARRTSLEGVAQRVAERRERFTRRSDALREDTGRFIARCEQSTARVRALIEAIGAMPAYNTSTSPSNAQPASETATGTPTTTQSPAGVQTMAPQPAPSISTRIVPEPATLEDWKKVVKTSAVDPVKEVLISAAGEAAIQLFKRSYEEHFRWYVQRAHIRKYAAYAKYAEYGAWVGYAWTGANILMDTSIKSMDQKTEEVEKNILLIGDYARALERLKKLGRLKPSDPGYAALREMLVRTNKEMPSTTGQYSINTPAGTLDLEFVYKSFSPAILLQETLANLAGQYAASKVEVLGKALSTLTKSEKGFIGKAGSEFFARFGQTVTPNAATRAYQHFIQGAVEGGVSVGTESGVKNILKVSEQVGEQLRMSRQIESGQKK